MEEFLFYFGAAFKGLKKFTFIWVTWTHNFKVIIMSTFHYAMGSCQRLKKALQGNSLRFLNVLHFCRHDRRYQWKRWGRSWRFTKFNPLLSFSYNQFWKIYLNCYKNWSSNFILFFHFNNRHWSCPTSFKTTWKGKSQTLVWLQYGHHPSSSASFFFPFVTSLISLI